jgi:hypothetical protein
VPQEQTASFQQSKERVEAIRWQRSRCVRAGEAQDRINPRRFPMRPLCFIPLIALVAVVSFLGLQAPSGTAAPVPRLKDPAPGQERSFEIADKVPMVFC